MRRCVLAVVATAVLSVPGAAVADPGGTLHVGSCGLAREFAIPAVQDPSSPGATEWALVPPNSWGCTGDD